MRLRRARYGDASIVELVSAGVTASVHEIFADESMERLRAPPVDRSRTFHVSDNSADDDDDPEVDLGVVLHLSPDLGFADEQFFSPN